MTLNKKEYQKQYRKTHRAYFNAYLRAWKKKHWTQVYAENQAYFKAHPDKVRQYQKRYYSSEKGRLNNKKKNAKRKSWRKKHGFIMINEPFWGGVGHHINKDYVLYIPVALHTSIKHNLRTRLNMDLINEVAWNWVLKNGKLNWSLITSLMQDKKNFTDQKHDLEFLLAVEDSAKQLQGQRK